MERQVRIHSECLTGDVFGSLKCDCQAQLREFQELMGAADHAVLVPRDEPDYSHIITTVYSIDENGSF